MLGSSSDRIEDYLWRVISAKEGARTKMENRK